MVLGALRWTACRITKAGLFRTGRPGRVLLLLELMEMLVLAAVLLGVPLLVAALVYNGFISRRNAMRYAFATIDVQLKKRWELVPNLVETVKGYAAHERATLEQVVRLRDAARASSGSERMMIEGELSAGLTRVIGLAEAYPQLKADGLFLNLQRNLSEIEAQIAAARSAYNAAVTDWNRGVESFPGNLFASVFGFRRADWFEVQENERAAADVRF